MCVCVTILLKNEAMNLKGNKQLHTWMGCREEIWEGLEEGKGKGDDVIIL